MFDTVKLDIPLSLTKQEIDAVKWTKTNSTVDMTRGQTSRTIFKHHHDSSFNGAPFIRYTYKEEDLTKSWLKVEVSIPTFCCGSNVYEVTECDLENFYKVLRKYISLRLNVSFQRIPHIKYCTVEKVHVCKNFDVGSNKQHYLRALSTCTISKYQKRQYCSIGSDQIESVEWKASKRKEKIYDKEAEIRQQKSYPGKLRHQQKVRGILRYEIELTDREIRSISPTRKAGEVLRMDKALEVLQKGLNRNGISSGVKYTSLHQTLDAINQDGRLPLRTKTALVAFTTELLINGEEECRNKYAESTFRKRKRELRTVLGVDELLIGDILLPPLSLLDEQKKTASVLGK